MRARKAMLSHSQMWGMLPHECGLAGSLGWSSDLQSVKTMNSYCLKLSSFRGRHTKAGWETRKWSARKSLWFIFPPNHNYSVNTTSVLEYASEISGILKCTRVKPDKGKFIKKNFQILPHPALWKNNVVLKLLLCRLCPVQNSRIKS